MNHKTALIYASSIVMSALIFAVTFALWGGGPRYQMTVLPNRAVVLDTRTGQVWEDWGVVVSGGHDPRFSQPK